MQRRSVYKCTRCGQATSEADEADHAAKSPLSKLPDRKNKIDRWATPKYWAGRKRLGLCFVQGRWNVSDALRFVLGGNAEVVMKLTLIAAALATLIGSQAQASWAEVRIWSIRCSLAPTRVGTRTGRLRYYDPAFI